MECRKIGILGGTFDPIHNGHLLLGESAREQFSLDRIIFMPNNLAHLKNRTEISSGDTRYQMVKMAIADNPYFTCSRLEIDKPEGTYTIDTINELKLTVRVTMLSQPYSEVSSLVKVYSPTSGSCSAVMSKPFSL